MTKALTLEQRVTALEAKIDEVSRRSNQTALTALDCYNDAMREIRLAEQGIKQANEFTGATIQVKLICRSTASEIQNS
jgi:Na+-translocating ferredoxin:NAD+ oxidoreductase RnfG subunit